MQFLAKQIFLHHQSSLLHPFQPFHYPPIFRQHAAKHNIVK